MTMKNIDFTTTAAPFSGLDWEQAYESVKSDLLALTPDALLSINLDIPSAVATAAGVLPEINALRAQIQTELPGFNIESFDKLAQYAMAAGHADSMLAVSTGPQEQLRAIVEEAGALREVLRSDAQALAKRGLIAQGSLMNLSGQRGYKNIAADLRNLVNILRANWDRIESKCATTKAEIDRAALLSSSLIQGVGLREQGPSELSDLAEMRVRAYSLFVGTYQDVRRAVAYLRGSEGDVDSIIPSLHASRNRRTRKAKEPVVEDATSSNDGEAPPTAATETPSATIPTATNVVALRPSAPAATGTEHTG
jgi:hypothetical protein